MNRNTDLSISSETLRLAQNSDISEEMAAARNIFDARAGLRQLAQLRGNSTTDARVFLELFNKIYANGNDTLRDQAENHWMLFMTEKRDVFMQFLKDSTVSGDRLAYAFNQVCLFEVPEIMRFISEALRENQVAYAKYRAAVGRGCTPVDG